MKTALLICTYNRPEYLEQTLSSLSRADLSGLNDILIVDDCSTDTRILDFITGSGYTHYAMPDKGSIKTSLLHGYTDLFKRNDIVINLDSDTLVRNDFVQVLLDLHKRLPNRIITGFNCHTKNRNGSVRHEVIEEGDGYNIKKSVGGVNMLLTKQLYEKHVRPALLGPGNWDHEASKSTTGIACTVPSVVNHIGFNSAMGHTKAEPPDTADDFKELHLQDVTLIGADCKDIYRLLHAIDESTKNILFGDVRILSSIKHPAVTDTITPITSKEAYSEFCIKELPNYVKTKYALVVQYDGYVKNHKAWQWDWLGCDYIGAPWEWLPENKVGNGGFSLRSKKLMDLCETIIKDCHPEDYQICNVHAKKLTAKGIKFAPLDIARQFSIEGYKSDKQYRGQFGFHGHHVRFKSTDKTLCVLQPFGLGDVIFTQTLINNLGDYNVIWPVKEHYVNDLNRAYPSVKFIPEHESPVRLNIQYDRFLNGVRAIPIRWSDKLQRVPYHQVMRAKYDMYRQDWNTWKDQAMWHRDVRREHQLLEHLGIKPGDKFVLVNTTYGCMLNNEIEIPFTGKRVTMRQIDGYSLFDWARVMELAAEIHTVSTSILFILDLIKTGPVHVYIRRPHEGNHDNYNYIFTDRKFVYAP